MCRFIHVGPTSSYCSKICYLLVLMQYICIGSFAVLELSFCFFVQNPILSSTGGGLQPSIFASVKASSLQGSNMASLFSDHSSAQPVTCVSGSISPARDTTYALASPSGSIHLIYLPPPNEQGTTSLSACCGSSTHCLDINKVHV